MTQSTLWQDDHNQLPYAELCNALYEREIGHLAVRAVNSPLQLQAKLKSLSYYVSRTAYRILQTQSPIEFDVQNASWFHKQSASIPVQEQSKEAITHWFANHDLSLGLVLPVLVRHDDIQRIILDTVDKVDIENQRVRFNYHGWFDYKNFQVQDSPDVYFLKPLKKVMIAACCGHQWKNAAKTNPTTLDLRELMLTCSINWQNFAKPIIKK